MFNRQQQPIRSFLSAAAIFASCGFAIDVARAVSAETPEVKATISGKTSSATEMIERSSTLINQKKFWQARTVLVKVMNDLPTLTDKERDRARVLMDDATTAIRSLDPATLSLQKADSALDSGDIVFATAQCDAVIASSTDSTQTTVARELLAEANLMRDEFAGHSSETLARAVTLFDTGKYAQAKVLLGSVRRSGVTLSDQDSQTLETYQNRMVALETTRGALVDTNDAAAAMFDDPGVIKRRTPPPTQPDQNYPSKEETTSQPAKVEPKAQPAATPPAAPAKTATPAAKAPEKAAAPAAAAPAPKDEPKFAPITQAPATAAPAESAGKPIPVIATEQPAQSTPAPAPVPAPAPAAAPAPAPAATPAPAAAPAAVASQPSIAQPSNTPTADDLQVLARKMRASETKTQADQDFANGRYGKALEGYRSLRDVFAAYMTPADLADVNRRIAESETLLRGNTSEKNLLDQQIDTTKLNHDASLASYQNLIEQSDKAAKTGDLGKARDLATRAKVTLQTNRNFFSETEFQTLEKQASDKIALYVKQGEDMAIQTRDAMQKDQQIKAQNASKAAAQKKETQILESLQRVRALQQEMKYTEALQVLDQILFMDPHNPAAEILKEIIQNTEIYNSFSKLQERKGYGAASLMVDDSEATRVPRMPMEYPTDWPSITYRRGEPMQFQDSPENRRTMGMMQTKHIPADFKDIPLENALAYVQKTTGVNMDINWAALEKVGIDRETAISMKIPDASAETIMERIIEKVSPDKSSAAGWAYDKGILTVSSEQQINSRTVTEIYDVRDLLVEIPNFTNAPEFDLATVLKSDSGSSNSAPFQNSGKASLEHRTTPEQRTKEVIDILTNTVAHDTWQENGGDVGFVQQFQGALVVTTTPRVHKSIDGLLAKLRQQRALQINCETRFLLVSNDFFEQIGFDLDIYLNGTNNQVRTAQAANPAVVPSDFFPNGVYNRNLSVPQVGPLTGTTLQNVNQNVPGPQNGFSPVNASQNSLGLAESMIPKTGLLNNLTGGVAPALGISGQFLDDIQVDFMVKATQADRRSVQLTAPRLTFANGQIANIVVATQVAFVSDLTPVVSQSSAAFDPQLDVVSEGVRLLVEGYVSADRRYVTMNISTSTSKIDGFTNAPVTAIAGGVAVNSASVQSFIQRPTVTVTQVNTSVTVPDQGTCLLGGQRLVNEAEVETGVPILSKIPILGRLFDNRITNKTEATLLILMKPTILIQNEEEERQFPGLNDSARSGL